MSEREFDFYAEALVERNMLRITDSLHKEKSAQLNQRDEEQKRIISLLEADIAVERGEIDRQKEINTSLETRLNKREFWIKFWRKSAIICGGIIAAEITVLAIIAGVN